MARLASVQAFADDSEASCDDAEARPLRPPDARSSGHRGAAALLLRGLGVTTGALSALFVGVVAFSGARGSPSLPRRPISADRVFSAEGGRKVCTTVQGKRVMGSPYSELGASNLSGDKCRWKCEGDSECGCYSFDPTQGCELKGDPCGGHVVGAAVEKVVSGECSNCPFCSPEGLRSRPWVVIPFYARDLCKMKILTGSLNKHDPNNELGDIVLLWLDKDTPGTYQDDIDAIIGYANEQHDAHFHDFSWTMNAGLKGWEVQQVMKLKAALLVDAEFYVVLDAKNAFIRDVQPETFISPCNQGIIFAQWTIDEQGSEKRRWFDKAANALGVSMPDGKMSGSITPCVMHTQSVLDMLRHLSEAATVLTLCSGPLCGYIKDGATEFALYYTYVRQLADEKCIHNAVWHHPAMSLWNGIDVNARLRDADVAADEEHIIMFGAQPGTLEGLGTDDYYRLAYKIEEIYGKAGLHDAQSNSVESLVACVAPDR